MWPFINFFVDFFTNISSIYVIYWSLFVLDNQIKMFRFIKGNVVTDKKLMKVHGLNMEPMLDHPNGRNITNNVSLEGFYNLLLIRRLHYFPKVWQEIIFIIDGKCCVLLEKISSLETQFDAITPLSERYRVFGVQVDSLEGRYLIFSGNFLDSLKTHIDRHKEFRTPLVVGIDAQRK